MTMPTTPPVLRNTCRSTGFTLIELLVVVAIITTLLAIVVPLASHAVARGRGLECQGNLRQLGWALTKYYQDNGGLFPPLTVRERPEGAVRDMAEQAGFEPVDDPRAGGCNWTIALWPYHRRLELYTCPLDPRLDGGGPETDELPPGSPFADAPPLSYGLNTLLFRMMPAMRRQSGASWGTEGNEFSGNFTFTRLTDQQRQFPRLDDRIVMFCGLRGFPLGHQSNIAWRDAGFGDVTRTEWHPWPGAEPFTDAHGHGSYYLFFDGRAEYREDFPSRFEWGLDLEPGGD